MRAFETVIYTKKVQVLSLYPGETGYDTSAIIYVHPDAPGGVCTMGINHNPFGSEACMGRQIGPEK